MRPLAFLIKVIPVSDTPDFPSSQKLGAGRLVGATFRSYFQNFGRLFLIAIIPALVVNVLASWFSARYFASFMANPNDPMAIFNLDYFMLIFAPTILGILVQAFILLAAADVLQGQAIRVGNYVNRILTMIVPLLVVSILVYLGVVVGVMLLIVPGLWLAAYWSVFLPALLVEERGFGAMGRSAQLTEGYRWPIVGAGILILLVVYVLSIVSGLVAGYGMMADPSTMAQFSIVGTILTSLVAAVSYGVMALFQLLLFTRLIDIKEGGSDLAGVFE